MENTMPESQTPPVLHATGQIPFSINPIEEKLSFVSITPFPTKRVGMGREVPSQIQAQKVTATRENWGVTAFG
jgi:hypothetical protein